VTIFGTTIAIRDWDFHGFVEVGAIGVETYPKRFLKAISLFPEGFLILPTEPGNASSDCGFLFDPK
jgi:hypothetical protein